MFCYRIADNRHPIFSPVGAMLKGGRWNSIGNPVIYTAETYAGALLEVLVHANLSAPPVNHRLVLCSIPDSVAIETCPPERLPGWAGEDLSATQAFGDQWLREARTAVLKVPGVVTRGREHNLVLNPAHLDFVKIHASAPEPIDWDRRLFPKP